ncbi:hypothetical protein RM550_26460 [Streptomyces sp. DSM 41527]|uniref:Uncharacterized protein n=1 Tax=Streptomyces mooreae TaxID=3075523 RepID=A0ABU2TE53_9ACTN|nr:hypothetical protein [Streptomyces sp. DSM 41527]MDT0459218.1 hypothetical protein [Streptomyces sp. DSM 41527]
MRTALLDFASETPDNKDAAQRIAVLHTGEPRQGPRLCLSRSGASFAEVVLSADGGPAPSCVLEQLPDLTQDEWNAVIHVTGLTLMAFEPEPAREVGQRPGRIDAGAGKGNRQPRSRHS